MRDDYLRLALITYALGSDFDKLFGSDWVEDGEYGRIAISAVAASFERYGLEIDPSLLAEEFHSIFASLTEGGAISYEGDEYTQPFFRLDPTKKKQILAALRQENRAFQRIQKLGPKAPVAMTSALSKALAEISEDPASLKGEDDVVPLEDGFEVENGVNWNEVSEKIRLSPRLKQRIAEEARSLKNVISQAEMPEETRKDALRYVAAIIELIDASNPPWREIVALLSNPIFGAFLNVAGLVQIIVGAI